MVKAKEKVEKPLVTRFATVTLEGNDGIVLPVWSGHLERPEPGPLSDDFADRAFAESRNSLRKLMVPYYRLVVLLDGVRQGYGLDRWVKLTDSSEDQENVPRGKQAIRRKAVA